MIRALAQGARQVVEIAAPSTTRSLRRAGALDLRAPVALARTLPWLLGRGPSLGILSRMNALALGGKLALHDRNGGLDFAGLERRANRAARALEAHARGGAVALLLRNGREFCETLLGAQKAGIRACPLNTWAAPKELVATLANASPSVLVYDTAHAEQVRNSAPGGTTLVAVGDTRRAVPGSLEYEQLLAAAPSTPLSPVGRGKHTSTVVIHTSGTTGTPKGAARNAAATGIGALARLLDVVPYHRDDVVFCPAPLFHSFGLATFALATAVGATLVLPERFDPRESLRDIERHRSGAASFVPVMIKRIVSLPADVRLGHDLSSLRIVLASGSTMSEELRAAARQVFGDVLYDLYGSTEAGWVAVATPEDMRLRPATVGRPVAGVDVAVFSPDGRRLPRGRTGELHVKSKILFEGYTSGESRAGSGDYLSMGDLGHLSEDGYLFVEGRADDMVVVGAENVYPAEVEHVVESVHGVTECAVVGVADEEFGQVLAAVVAGTASTEDVLRACASQLASYKVPRRVVAVDELPRTSTGKVLKRELQDLLETKGATGS